ncbi:hypothetical protein CDD81_6087 [Ophiocordyceps australis]|uniref:Enoyl-CoA hydratase n=1 Tax=Ophiocordyceps australis TaxID=1399860 RepID=A0A2C5Y6Q2_9HYPO|nr:hypothetical protein CDD81_6087 [Ophiocordyceps australis]
MTSKQSLPNSYAQLSLDGIRFSHHPASSPSVTPIVLVQLHRPAHRNAFTHEMAHSLVTAFNLLSADDRVRAVILTSSDESNKTFCVGMDLKAGGPSRLELEGPRATTDHRDMGGAVGLAIYRCNKPVIAALNGTAVGIGITMALPATIRIASRDAKIGFVFARRGFTMEACSSFFLPRLIGASRALHLLSVAAPYPATHDLLKDLFSQVVAPDQVLPCALAIAEDMVANVSLVASTIMKDMIYRGPASPEEAHLLESNLFLSLFLSQDAQEGKESFLQKRTPDFQGTMADAPPVYPWWAPVNVKPKSHL